MNAYLHLVFCKQEELRSFGAEVAVAIKRVAGNNMKRGECGRHNSHRVLDFAGTDGYPSGVPTSVAAGAARVGLAPG